VTKKLQLILKDKLIKARGDFPGEFHNIYWMAQVCILQIHFIPHLAHAIKIVFMYRKNKLISHAAAYLALCNTTVVCE